MAIPAAQIETWSSQGSITNSKATGDSVKYAIDNYQGFPAGVNYSVYLSGSYKNDTNTYGQSDVDVVVELDSVFFNNLTPEEKNRFGFTNAVYGLTNFKNDIHTCLNNYYQAQNIEVGNKVFKIRPNANRLSADVLVCASYRHYHSKNDVNGYRKGIAFFPGNTNTMTVNFPKIHSNNATQKHQATGMTFKPSVRVFKNIRNHLVTNAGYNKAWAPSYFLECLISNVPTGYFVLNNHSTIFNLLSVLQRSNKSNYLCMNGITPLWGDGPQHWNLTSANHFINQAVNLWDNWYN